MKYLAVLVVLAAGVLAAPVLDAQAEYPGLALPAKREAEAEADPQFGFTLPTIKLPTLALPTLALPTFALPTPTTTKKTTLITTTKATTPAASSTKVAATTPSPSSAKATSTVRASSVRASGTGVVPSGTASGLKRRQFALPTGFFPTLALPTGLPALPTGLPSLPTGFALPAGFGKN